YGHDLSPETDPYGAGLGWTVTLDDGADFTGRVALAALATRAPARRLSCLRLLERGVPRAGYVVRTGDVDDGHGLVTLTSGVFSPTLRIGIAMAYLPVALSEPGTRLSIAIHGRDLPAEVVPRPFYRRDD
ncbi:MAG: glycine cleavage system aminomethyltransferase GcvT, partial [Chloroflexi bacterium]|nr:glycine cleavage system aminomethyltransferase GcvT [Chloroflexota bacterium]